MILIESGQLAEKGDVPSHFLVSFFVDLKNECGIGTRDCILTRDDFDKDYSCLWHDGNLFYKGVLVFGVVDERKIFFPLFPPNFALIFESRNEQRHNFGVNERLRQLHENVEHVKTAVRVNGHLDEDDVHADV